MRITEIQLQCDDIMWFGVDSNGYIFECTSAGCGNVPEYVCKSLEETELLLQYFTEKAPIVTKPVLLIQKKDNQLTKDAIDLSSKGIFCFDITDYNNNTIYYPISKPEKPINVKNLPNDIQNLLVDHIYNGDVSIANSLVVEHAY